MHVFDFFQEGGTEREINLCEGRWTERETQVFKSDSNRVTIRTRLAGSATKSSLFLLHYQGKFTPTLTKIGFVTRFTSGRWTQAEATILPSKEEHI